jgi:predicted kinase
MQKLWILQGHSGSGKSTVAEQIATQENAIICSTDNYFLNENNEYIFDASKLEEFHQLNIKNAIDLMSEGHSVIIDNTNIYRWNCFPYVNYARYNNIFVEFIRVEGNYKNNHNVPKKVVLRMKSQMETLSIESVLNSGGIKPVFTGRKK